MNLDDLLKHDSEWLRGVGPNADIVMSSRTRLARNIAKFSFSHWADNLRLEEIMVKVKEAVESLGTARNLVFIRLRDIPELDRQFLVERHLMSPEHAKNVDYKALIVDPNESMSIMVNEEDHLRIQVFQSGFNLKEAWRIIDDLDTALSQQIPYAYSPKWGYLTACPTNTGTALRGTVMVHLPALVFTGQIGKVLQATAKLGLNVRGMYGEGTEASGNVFQVSNQASMGRTEEDLIDNIGRIISQIVAREDMARKMIIAKNKEDLVDRVWRAYGTLKNAHIISSEETIALLSVIRLGVDLGIITSLTIKAVNELFILTRPAHLQKLEGKVLAAEDRDVIRATLIRTKIT